MGLPKFLQNRWWVVFASVVGLTVGTGSLTVFTFGVFLVPVTQELGWSRGTFSSALALASILSTITTPIFGVLIDRYGIRAVALPALVLFALGFGALSLMTPAVWLMYLIYGGVALTSSCGSPMMYSRAVSAWFDKERGLALGIATSGVGLGTALMPLLAQFFIAHYGWRLAYIDLAATALILAFPAVGLFLRDPPGHHVTTQGAGDVGRPGMSALEAVKTTHQFWFLSIVFFLGAIAINGTLAHIVALLIDRGIAPAVAAKTLAVAGVAIILGRILAGHLLDRLNGPLVAASFLFLSALGCVLLASGLGGIVPLAAVILCGMGVGAEVDMMGFFISRYFGIRAFAAIYGYIFPFFTVGVGLGPYFMGLAFDLTHAYTLMLAINAGLLVIAAFLLAKLGAYRYPRIAMDAAAGRKPAPAVT
jgi:MFS family permease